MGRPAISRELKSPGLGDVAAHGHRRAARGGRPSPSRPASAAGRGRRRPAPSSARPSGQDGSPRRWPSAGGRSRGETLRPSSVASRLPQVLNSLASGRRRRSKGPVHLPSWRRGHRPAPPRRVRVGRRRQPRRGADGHAAGARRGRAPARPRRRHVGRRAERRRAGRGSRARPRPASPSCGPPSARSTSSPGGSGAKFRTLRSSRTFIYDNANLWDYVHANLRVSTFDQLTVPFGAVTTDAETGRGGRAHDRPGGARRRRQRLDPWRVPAGLAQRAHALRRWAGRQRADPPGARPRGQVARRARLQLPEPVVGAAREDRRRPRVRAPRACLASRPRSSCRRPPPRARRVPARGRSCGR